MRQGRPANHLFLCPRPYGKDVPRLDYWQAYETIMKKFGGRPHWAKVTQSRGCCYALDFHQRAPSSPLLGASKRALGDLHRNFLHFIGFSYGACE